MTWMKSRRPSPALVISLIALFVALGGTGYAAFSLPKNSVGTKQLRKNAVIGSKIKNNSITGPKVKNGSLTGADVKDGSLTGADINVGTLGTVPSATNATNATNAGHAGSADNATHATNADHATSADSATVADNTTGLAGPLKSGQTLRGVFEVAGSNTSGFVDGNAISFLIPLAAAPTGHVIPSGGPPTTDCPGSSVAPEAASGQLCYYIAASTNATGLSLFATTKFGDAYIPTGVIAPNSYQVEGTWAVTG